MTQAAPDFLVLSLGPDLAAAQALARACGLDAPVPAYDEALLDQALQAGRRCAVVWSDPQTALAAALRDGTPPSRVGASWVALANSVLARTGQADLGPDALILIDSSAIRSQAGAMQIGPGLSLAHALRGPLAPAPRDTAALLAQVMLPHLPDLAAAWQRLRDASVPATLTPAAETDLDRLADHCRALDRGLKESALLRDQLQAVSLLTVPPAAPEPEPESRAAEIALLRAQLLAIAALLHDDSGAAGVHPGPASPAQADEVRLLRAHLAYLQSDLGLGGDAPAEVPDAPPPAGFEAAMARVLADLVQETNRRILAERETMAARKTLRHLGIEAPVQQGRNSVAFRPQG